jgi:hypothetical protein
MSIIKKCQFCGGDFRVKPSKINRQFCRSRCANDGGKKTKTVEVNGVKLSLANMCRKYNINAGTVSNRIRRGTSVAEAFISPIKGTGARSIKIGTRFGRLTTIGLPNLIKRYGPKNRGTRAVRVRCDCGKIKIVGASFLLRGVTKSCGCIRAEVSRLNGRAMAKYFLTINGVKMSVREAAAATGISIDIIRERLHDGWTPFDSVNTKPKIQNKPYSGSRHIIKFNGKSKSIKDWATELGFNPGMLSSRITVLGWPIKEALTTPVGFRRASRYKKTISRDPKYNQRTLLAKIFLHKTQRAAGRGKYPTLLSLGETPSP